MGTECLSAPLGHGASPHPPSVGMSRSVSDEGGRLVPGLVSMGVPQGLDSPGLWKSPVKERVEGG